MAPILLHRAPRVCRTVGHPRSYVLLWIEGGSKPRARAIRSQAWSAACRSCRPLSSVSVFIGLLVVALSQTTRFERFVRNASSSLARDPSGGAWRRGGSSSRSATSAPASSGESGTSWRALAPIGPPSSRLMQSADTCHAPSISTSSPEMMYRRSSYGNSASKVRVRPRLLPNLMSSRVCCPVAVTAPGYDVTPSDTMSHIFAERKKSGRHHSAPVADTDTNCLHH